MNVTNIGSPMATPASQAAGADAAGASGFAGLLGTGAGNGAQGSLVFGTPVFGTFATAQPTTITAQTGAALLPGATDAGALPVASDRPQVAMTQLLATAAPVAAAPTVVAGGNPLADAIAKALAKPGATDSAAPEIKTTNAGDPKTATPRVLAATSTPAEAATAKPKADEAVPLDTPEALDLEAPTLPRATLPAKNGGKPARAVSADDAPPLADAAAAAATAQPQPIAVPQLVAAQPTPAAPATPRAGTQAKTDGTGAVRTAKVETAVAGNATSLQPAADKATELTSAVTSPGTGGGTEGGKGEGNPQSFAQQPFAQQLAATDGRHAGLQPQAAAPIQAATPTAAAHTATPAGEPVINGRVGELGRTLGVEIARKVDAGEDTLRVRLNPAELGRVEVTLAFDDNGRVQATMRADSQHTLDLLRQDAPDLGRALDQAGIRSDAGSFRFESRDGGAGSNANGQSASQQQSQSRGSNQQFQDEPDIQAAAYRPIRSDGQVDLIA